MVFVLSIQQKKQEITGGADGSSAQTHQRLKIFAHTQHYLFVKVFSHAIDADLRNALPVRSFLKQRPLAIRAIHITYVNRNWENCLGTVIFCPFTGLFSASAFKLFAALHQFPGVFLSNKFQPVTFGGDRIILNIIYGQ